MKAAALPIIATLSTLPRNIVLRLEKVDIREEFRPSRTQEC